MDLRGFSPANQGCIFELEQLTAHELFAPNHLRRRQRNGRNATESHSAPAGDGPWVDRPYIGLEELSGAIRLDRSARLMRLDSNVN
jgi:hypothetical protein